MTDENLNRPTAAQPVYALISDMAMAGKIVKAANSLHLPVRNFDRVESLMRSVSERQPCLVILDFERKEAEAYRILKLLGANSDLKGVGTIGFVTNVKRNVAEEAQRAGCLRVYMKTDFLKNLNDLLMRHAK